MPCFYPLRSFDKWGFEEATLSAPFQAVLCDNATAWVLGIFCREVRKRMVYLHCGSTRTSKTLYFLEVFLDVVSLSSKGSYKANTNNGSQHSQRSNNAARKQKRTLNAGLLRAGRCKIYTSTISHHYSKCARCMIQLRAAPRELRDDTKNNTFRLQSSHQSPESASLLKPSPQSPTHLVLFAPQNAEKRQKQHI